MKSPLDLIDNGSTVSVEPASILSRRTALSFQHRRAPYYAFCHSFVPRVSKTRSSTLPHIAPARVAASAPGDGGALEAGGRRAYSPGARGESAPAAARAALPIGQRAGKRTR